MVSLAKKFKDKPFHVLASHCQGGVKDQVLKALEKDGWSKEMNNFSVSSQTQFKQGVMRGNHVPYYFIFDHTGKLRYHHMAGPWHGGDGDKYQKLVADLIREIPKDKGKGGGSKPLSKLRDWSNLNGDKLKAELLEVKEGKAKFRKRNGSIFWYELDKLSAEDRETIKDLIKE